jgi:hypothetical protein
MFILIASIHIVPLFLMTLMLELFRDQDESYRSRGYGNQTQGSKNIARIFTDYGYWRMREYNELKHQIWEWIQVVERNMDSFITEVKRRKSSSKWRNLCFYMTACIGIVTLLYCISQVKDMYIDRFKLKEATEHKGAIGTLIIIIVCIWIYLIRRRSNSESHYTSPHNLASNINMMLEAIHEGSHSHLTDLFRVAPFNEEKTVRDHSKLRRTILSKYLMSRFKAWLSHYIGLFLIPIVAVVYIVPKIKEILKFIERTTTLRDEIGDVYCFSTMRIKIGHPAFSAVFKKRLHDDDYSMNHQEDKLTNIISTQVYIPPEDNIKVLVNRVGKFEKSTISFIVNNYLGGYYGSESPSEDSWLILRD